MNSKDEKLNQEQELDHEDAAPPGSAFDVFEALLSSLNPLFELARDLSGPDMAMVFRKAFELFEEHIRQQQRAFIEFAVENGWIGLERHITDEIVALLLKVIEENGVEAANARVPQVFPFESIETVVRGWYAVPYFENRLQICSDVLAAYKVGLHGVVIPALLPLAEGLALEIVKCNPRNTDTVTRAAALNAKMNSDRSTEEFCEAIARIVEEMYYARTDFGKPAEPGWFNRHRILHGRSADYATPSNSIRAFLLVDTFTDVWHELNRLGSKVGSN